MRIESDVNMVPPEASACMLWGGMSSCGLKHQINNCCQDRLVLRSAPHVLRRGRYTACAFSQSSASLISLISEGQLALSSWPLSPPQPGSRSCLLPATPWIVLPYAALRWSKQGHRMCIYLNFFSTNPNSSAWGRSRLANSSNDMLCFAFANA